MKQSLSSETVQATKCTLFKQNSKKNPEIWGILNCKTRSAVEILMSLSLNIVALSGLARVSGLFQAVPS